MTPQHQAYLEMNTLVEQYAEVREYLESIRLKIEEKMKVYPFEKFYGEAGKVCIRKGYYLQSYRRQDVDNIAQAYGIPEGEMEDILKVTYVPPTMVIECNQHEPKES